MTESNSAIRVCVTGAGGFIGRHVCAELLRRGIVPIAVDARDVDVDSRCRFVKTDIFSGFDAKIGKIDCLIHLAWKDGFVHDSESHVSSLPMHFRFLREAMESGCGSVAVMGSMHEVGYCEGCIAADTPCNPMSMYGIAKNALRQMLFAYLRHSTCSVSLKWLRGFYILGDDCRNNSIFSKILLWDKEGRSSFPFTDGMNQYDFIHIDEMARQIVSASLQNGRSGIINCCTGRPRRLRDVVNEFIKENGLKIRPEYGVYPARPYDSPLTYGDPLPISQIMEAES